MYFFFSSCVIVSLVSCLIRLSGLIDAILIVLFPGCMFITCGLFLPSPKGHLVAFIRCFLLVVFCVPFVVVLFLCFVLCF